MPTGPKPKSKLTAVCLALQQAERVGDCLIRRAKHTIGAGYKSISAVGRCFYAHRLVWEVINERSASGLVIRHSCDTPACINPAHLFAGSHGDNVTDKVNRGRQSKGEIHYASRMTEEFVTQLRAMSKPINFQSLCNETGISVGALKAAYYGHTWKHLA